MSTLVLKQYQAQLAVKDQIEFMTIESADTWEAVQNYLRSHRGERDKLWLGERLDAILAISSEVFHREPTKEERDAYAYEEA